MLVKGKVWPDSGTKKKKQSCPVYMTLSEFSAEVKFGTDWGERESLYSITLHMVAVRRNEMESFTPLQSLCDAWGRMWAALFTQIMAGTLKVYSFDAQPCMMQITFSTCGPEWLLRFYIKL